MCGVEAHFVEFNRAVVIYRICPEALLRKCRQKCGKSDMERLDVL